MVLDTGGALATRRIRRLRAPAGFAVDAGADGVPKRISLHGNWLNVTLARRIWRVDQHWWRSDHVQRQYFRVLPEDSPAMTIYYDLISQSWYRQEF